MNAHEARKLSEAANHHLAQKDRVYNLIKEATGKGETHIFTYTQLDPFTETLLRTDGYKIEFMNDRNEILNKISW